MVKICKLCLHGKDISEFGKLKNDRDYLYSASLCKPCANIKHNEANVNRARRKKAKLVELAGGKCVRCGYNKCLRALDFDHIKESDKEYHFKKVLYGGVKLKTFLLDFNKFQLLCSNCHREKHCKDVEHHE